DWSSPMSCSASFPGTTCSDGYCVGPDPGGCSDQCSNGSKQCIDGDQFQTCDDYNGDGCSEWGNTMSCGASYPGTTCSAGWCVGPDPGGGGGDPGGGGGCSDQCPNGSKQCVDGDNYQDCGDFDGDGCAEWSGTYSCSGSWPGTVCQDGWCVNP